MRSEKLSIEIQNRDIAYIRAWSIENIMSIMIELVGNITKMQLKMMIKTNDRHRILIQLQALLS